MRAYTLFNPILRKYAKEHDLSPKEYLVKAKEVLSDMLREEKLNVDEAKTYYMATLYLDMDLEVLENRAVHLFLPEKPFCDWLVSCVKEPQPEHAGVLQENIVGNGVGVLHFPTSHNLHSVAFLCPKEAWTYDEGGNKIRMKDHQSLTMLFGAGGPGVASIFLGDENPEFKLPPEKEWYAKLICGLGMYVSCFPDMILDGAPHDLKHPGNHQYESSKVINISDKVKTQHQGGTHESPVAHFRKGHFRVLKSEKFTNKRFQSVFVHEAFVKGHAKTVLAPEEEDTCKQ